MKEIRALTGIRGIAALVVFLAHTRETLIARGMDLEVPEVVKLLFLTGGRQVDIFFVLSGFILALTYKDWFDQGVAPANYFKFQRRRFARIWPLHAFMLALTVALVIGAQLAHAKILNGLGRFSFSTLPLDFLLIHAWPFASHSATEEMVWNPPSWSISIEAFAYLLFPLFLFASRRARQQYPWVLLAASIAFGFACNALVPWDRTSWTGLARGLSEFGLGCVTANLYGSRAADWLRTNLGAAVAAAVLIVTFSFPPETWFGIGLVTAPLLLALSGKNFVSAALAWGPIYFLGEISYSIYLGHFLFGSVAYRLVSTEWMKTGAFATIVGFVVITAFVVGLSTVTYYAIERPGRDLLGGKRKPRPAAALADAASN
jgi:peptidoglycan/LPS O-acetylase OafA/YrhL